MKSMLAEILDISEKAFSFLKQCGDVSLPKYVPYLGMGSSFFACEAFKFMGFKIFPELASEYPNYLAKFIKQPLAVIVSQSGRSTESVQCTRLFDAYIAITNDASSPLATQQNVQCAINLLAGKEIYSSSKTYINSLLAHFSGFGVDALPAILHMNSRMSHYQEVGKKMADDVYEAMAAKDIRKLYVTGSGPNIATACQAALILSESTKLAFHGLPMAQYDHGIKETAQQSLLIQIISRGSAEARTRMLSQTMQSSGAVVLTVEDNTVEEHFSVLNNILPFNFMAYYLAEKLGITETFQVGGKVTLST